MAAVFYLLVSSYQSVIAPLAMTTHIIQAGLTGGRVALPGTACNTCLRLAAPGHNDFIAACDTYTVANSVIADDSRMIILIMLSKLRSRYEA